MEMGFPHGNTMENVPWDGTARIAFSMGPMGQKPRDSFLITSFLNRLANIGKENPTLKFIVIWPLWGIELKATPKDAIQQWKEKG